jgi:hypothetical protein
MRMLARVILLIGALVVASTAASSGASAERFWVAGRYDGNRVIVYFDAVKFNGTVPKTARHLGRPSGCRLQFSIRASTQLYREIPETIRR